MATPPFIGVFAATYGPYLGTGTAPGTITPGPTVGTPGILVLQTTGMANSLRSLATVTGSLPVEAALVKNADGSAISTPTFADCTYDSASGKWICDTPAPAGTYPAGAQLFRLKGSSPAVTAASLAGATVMGSTAPPYTGPPAEMPYVGDSTIFGYGQPDGEKPLTYWLQESLNNSYYNVYNYGYSGASTTQILSFIPSIINARPAGSPVLAGIMCGVNNFLHPERAAEAARTPQGTAEEIFQMHRLFHAAGQNTQCMSPLRTSNAAANAFIEQVRAILLANWQAEGCAKFTNTYNIPQFNPPTPDFYVDEYHPNIPGRLVLGEFVRPDAVAWAASKGIPVPAYTNIGASGSTPPAAPSVTFDAATRHLNATHVLGTGSLEVSAGGGAYVSFGDYVQVDDSQHPAQYYAVRTKALGSRPAGTPGYSPAIVAATISTRRAMTFQNAVAPVSSSGNSIRIGGNGGTINSALATTGGKGALEFTGYDPDPNMDAVLGFNNNAAADGGYAQINGIRLRAGALAFFGSAFYGQTVLVPALGQTDVVRIEYDGPKILIRVNGQELKAETGFTTSADKQQVDLWNGGSGGGFFNLFIESPALQAA